ncbi:MAG: TonB-dependent receptor, partial [bacterium]|nr:TonB-dependent receptor [bacterium]
MFDKKGVFQALILLIALYGLLFPCISAAQEEEPAKKELQTDELFRMSLEELMNVKITTAGKMAEKISEIPASVVIVTRHDIEMYGYQNLEEILAGIPGLYYINDYFLKNFGVRGFFTELANRNIIILVNNVPQTENMTSLHMLEQICIQVESIDRLEVIRGPMSVMYGTGAFFGVINIFTNKTNEDDPNNLVSVSMSSDKSKKVVVRASGQDGDFQYTFNGSYFGTAGIDAKLADIVSNPSTLPGLGLPVNHTTKEQLENENKYFNFSGAFKEFSFDAAYSEGNKEIMAILPAVGDGAIVINKVARINIKYSKRLSDKFKIDAKFGYFSHRMTFDYDMLVENFYGTQNNQSTGYKAEFNAFLNPSPKLNVILGLDYKKITDAVSEYNFPVWGLNYVHRNLVPGESMITQSLFTQLNYKFSEKFKIVAGLRLEQTPEWKWEWKEGNIDAGNPIYTTAPTKYSYTKAEFIPRLALIYAINENNFLKFLYGKAINRPAFFQQAANLGATTSLYPETIQTFELNYIGSLSSTFTVSLSFFRNMLDKLIIRTLMVDDEGNIISQFGNGGEMNTMGVELTINTRPFDNFHLEFSCTYQNSKDERPGFKDIEPGYSPNFLGYLKASYFFDEDISIAATGNYVDQMET